MSLWLFRLDGESIDLEGLRHSFPDPPVEVRKIGDQYLLALELPDEVADDESALAAAQKTLCLLNGITRCQAQNYRAPTLGGVSSIDPTTGRISTRIQSPSWSYEGRFSGSFTPEATQGGVTSLAYGTSLLKLGRENPHFERTLFLYGSVSHDWRGLYLVLEAAEDAFGGEEGLLGVPWVSPKLKLFKRTANSYRAIGVESRHGTLSSGVPTAGISLPEARQLIWEFLNAWIAKLSADGQ